MRRNPQLKEFVMVMGSACFWTADDQQRGLCDRWKYTRPVEVVLEEFDYLKLTGTPMRFTADGPVVTDW